MTSRGARFLAALFLTAVCWLAYSRVSLPRYYNGGDNLWTVPTAMSMVRYGNADVSAFAPSVRLHPEWEVWINDQKIDPRIVVTNNRPLMLHPVGSAFAVTPLAAWHCAWHKPASDPMAEAIALTPRIAHFFAALSVGLIFLLLTGLGASTAQAVALSLVFAFATPHFVTHADGLWSHNIFLPFFITALWLLIAENGRWAALAGLAAAMGYLIRPDSAVFIIAMGVYLLCCNPRRIVPFAWAGLIVAVLFVLWSRRVYCDWVPPYYFGRRTPTNLSLAYFPAGAAGHLFSPSRGIMIFAPILLFGMAGAVLAWLRKDSRAAFFRMISAMVLLHFVIVSVFQTWWAGFAYGPRYFCQVLPLYTLLLLPLWNAVARAARPARVAVAAAALAACAWGLFVNLRGVTDPRVHEWNATPEIVDTHHERLWDWHDMQIFRGWHKPARP